MYLRSNGSMVVIVTTIKYYCTSSTIIYVINNNNNSYLYGHVAGAKTVGGVTRHPPPQLHLTTYPVVFGGSGGGENGRVGQRRESWLHVFILPTCRHSCVTPTHPPAVVYRVLTGQNQSERIAQRRNLSLTTTTTTTFRRRPNSKKKSVSRRGRVLSAAVVAVRHRRRCRRRRVVTASLVGFRHYPVWRTPLTATANPVSTVYPIYLPYKYRTVSTLTFSSRHLPSITLPAHRISAITSAGG